MRSLFEEIENNITKKPKTYGDLFLMNLKHKAKRGINASSIADISSIPRATVIRKLKTLEKRKLILRNKKLEYSLGIITRRYENNRKKLSYKSKSIQ